MFWVILIILLIILAITWKYNVESDAQREAREAREKAEKEAREKKRQERINNMINSSFFKDLLGAVEMHIYDYLRNQIRDGKNCISVGGYIYGSCLKLNSCEIKFNDLGYQNITDSQIDALYGCFTMKGFIDNRDGNYGPYLCMNHIYWAPIVEKLKAEHNAGLKSIQ